MSRKRPAASPMSPNTAKRARPTLTTLATALLLPPIPATPTTPSHPDALALVRIETHNSLTLPGLPDPPNALDSLRTESYDIARAITQGQMSDVQTGKTYAGRWRVFLEWWEEFMDERCTQDPTFIRIPPFPITATKVVHYLSHERSREKKKGGRSEDGTQLYLAGTSVGKETIIGDITALECLRRSTKDRFPNDLEAHTKLRDDDRIRKIQAAAKHDEPKRIEKSQLLKASGTSQDTYTAEELEKLSLDCLTNPSTDYQLELSIRDRAMILFGCSTAFRGSSTRNVQWSDIFVQDLVNVDAGADKTVQVFTVYSDNAKHNQLGRVDEHGAVRHRKTELCTVGAVAMHLFTQWHVRDLPLPSFAPDFSEAAVKEGFGKYGRREWYEYLVFPSSKSQTTAMSFDNHAERVKLVHKRNNINISKVTHAARPFAAQNTRNHGASQSDTKALGGWQESGSYRAAYDRKIPLAALLGAATFNANKMADYFVIRGTLEPPPTVLATIFPWVEGEITAYHARAAADPRAVDMTLQRFLRLLQWLRVVLVQDMAILWSRTPQCLLFNHAPFNSPEFRAFADGADSRLRATEQRIKDGLNRVPEDYQLAVRSILLEDAAKNEEFRTQVLAALKSLPAISSSSSLQPTPASLSNPRGFIPPSLRQPLPLPTFSHRADTTSPGGPQAAPFITPLPPWAVAAAGSTAGSPAFLPAPPPPSSHGVAGSITITQPLRPSSASQTAHSVPTPDTPSPSSRGITNTPLAPFLQVPQAHSPMVPVELPLAPIQTVQNVPVPVPLPVPDDPMDGQWTRLTASFSAQKLDKYTRNNRWLRHTGVLIPDYKFPTSGSVRDCWQEWSVGLHGDFSLRELDAYFGSAWRENDGKKKTPYGKRKVVAEFIEKLAKQRPNWTSEIALRFVESQYPKFTARTFHDWIQKPPQRTEVLQRGMTWTP